MSHCLVVLAPVKESTSDSNNGEDYGNPYLILGLKGDPQTYSTADIKKAYRRTIGRKHPDHGGNATDFTKIKAAYDLLTDELRRATYDATGSWMKSTLHLQEGGKSKITVLLIAALDEIAQNPNQSIEYADPLNQVQLRLQGEIQELLKQKATLNSGLKRYAKLSKRIKFSGDPENDPIAQLLKQRLNAGRESLQRILEIIEINKVAIELIPTYKYEQDEPPPYSPPPGFVQISIAPGTGFFTMN